MDYLQFATTVLALLSPLGSETRSQEEGIVIVAKPPTFASWVKGINRDLDRRLRFPDVFPTDQVPAGPVSVTFQCDKDGFPALVVLSGRSGGRMFDRAAMRAVTGLRSLHPMPLAFKQNQRFIAHFIFANNRSTYDRAVTEMRARAAVSNARYANGDAPIALNVSSRAGHGS